MTRISLTGSMKSLVRVLNAVKKNLGTDEVIDRYIALPDLLDEECLQDSLLQEKKRRFKTGEDCSNGRMIAIVGTGETDKGFEIEFELLEEENCPIYSDWLDWGDIARVYGCTVFEDVELYRNGSFESYCGTSVYKPKDGTVKETRISPEHNLETFAHELNRLIEINPERYRPLKIRYLEDLIRRMKNEVNREKVDLMKQNLGSTGGHAVIPDGITCIPSGIFDRCDDLKSMFIPESVSEIGLCPFTGSSLESIEVDPKNPHFSSKGNCLLDKDGKTLLCGCKTSVVPEGVEVIAEYAFAECLGLTEITLPASIRKIGNMAFSRCPDLTGVTLNEGLTEIGGGAFLLCTSLEHITIPDSVTTIYAQAFIGCSSLTGVTLPKSVRNIYFDAFKDCPCLKDLVARFPDLFPEEKQ